MIHFKNNLLCSSVTGKLLEEDEKSLNDIKKSIDDVSNDFIKEISDGRTISRLSRQISSHLSLKYHLNAEMREQIMDLLLKVYHSGRFAAHVKLKLLRTMKSLTCKGAGLMTNFRFEWRPFWEEVVQVMSRWDRQLDPSCPQALSELIRMIVGLLHSSRRYLNTGDLVQMASELLQDTRKPVCVEGVLLLVTCLPTDFQGYDAVLSQWVSSWQALSGNAFWDSCWLTLLCRARKHSDVLTSQSSTLLPLLLFKARELLQLPVGAGGKTGAESQEFPRGVPSYYSHLLVSKVDYRKTAASKLAKLLYHLAQDVGPSGPVPADPMTMTPATDGLEDVISNGQSTPLPGYDAPSPAVSWVAREFALFLQSVRTCFHPSSNGSWTPLLAYFTVTFNSQVCRHVGYSLYSTALTQGKKNSTPFPRAPHLDTTRFLGGTMLSVLLEGLFSKNQGMSALFSGGLRNLVGLDPDTYGTVLLRFLLPALDPDAVSRSHQAPVALQTLNLCLRQLMFPQPTVLPYLKTILSTTLKSIDASESMKTTMVLNLYSNLLAWLPLRVVKDSELLDHGSYLTRLERFLGESETGSSTGLLEGKGEELSAGQKGHLRELFAYLTDEWVFGLLDKVFVLLESQEEKVKGARESPVSGAISECMNYMFHAVAPSSPDVSFSLQEKVEDRVLKYFLDNTPVRATKTSARMLDALVSHHTSILPSVLSRLLPTEVLDGAVGTEKVVFRLRVAGGALRSAQGKEIRTVLPLLESIFNTQRFSHHSEKTVRVAAGKLLKDALKGSASFYPTEVGPKDPSAKPLAHPSVDQEVQWHVPDADGLFVAERLLRLTLSTYLVDIRSSLSTQPTVGTDSQQGGSAKQREEAVAFSLCMVEKALRGAAEVLGDSVLHPTSNSPIPDLSHALPTGTEAVSPQLEISPSCGRVEALQQLSPESAVYFHSLRLEVLHFLQFLANRVNGLSAPFEGLKDHLLVQKQRLKLLDLVVTRRMANNKNVELVKKWVKYSKQLARSSVTYVVYKAMKRDLAVNPSAAEGDGQRGLEFWRQHDFSPNLVGCQALLQHVNRLRELSFSATRACHFHLDKGVCGTHDLQLLGLTDTVVELCFHRSDAVRPLALQTFEHCGGRFGFHLNLLLNQLLDSVTLQPAIPADSLYPRLEGVLALVKRNMMMKRVASNNSVGGEEKGLAERYLTTLLGVGPVFAQVGEPDKREKLMRLLMDGVVSYTQRWNFPPISAAKDGKSAQSNGRVLTAALLALNSSNSGSSPDGGSEGEEGASGAGSGGLRLGTVAGYIVVHLLGFCSESTEEGLWQQLWEHFTAPRSAGLPIQQFVLTGLVRLVQSADTQTAAGSPGEGAGLEAVKGMLRGKLCGTGAAGEWVALLQAVAQCHPRSKDDGSGLSAQWSKGVEPMLRALQQLVKVYPRDLGSTDTENALFSRNFSYDYASFFFSLFHSGLLGDPATGLLQTHTLEVLLSAVQELPATNDAEKRSNNSARAELFGGLLRYVHGRDEIHHLIGILTGFLREHVGKVSMDYCRDWQEAVYFGLRGSRSTGRDALSAALLGDFRKALSKSASVEGAMDEGSGEQEKEGFSELCKVFYLLFGALAADVSACAFRPAVSVQGRVPSAAAVSEVSALVLGVMDAADVQVVSVFRACRVQLAAILALCFNHSPLSDAASSLDGSTPSGRQNLMLRSLCEKLVHVSDGAVLEGVDAGSASVEGDRTSTAARRIQHGQETVCFLLQSLLAGRQPWRYSFVVPPLLQVALLGSVSADPEIAAICKHTSLHVSSRPSFTRTPSVAGSGSSEWSTAALGETLNLLQTHAQKESQASWRVREQALRGAVALMVGRWPLLTSDQRKQCKDIFSKGLKEEVPEILVLAREGMLAYLATKTASELSTIAAAYTRNSDTLATRAKKLRKLNKGSNEDKTEGKGDAEALQTTVLMLACLAQATPYDLPAYLPALMCSLVRHTHTNIALVKDAVTNTVQQFKQTHQDRWEVSFKQKFSREQLEDLQGVGAAHYYA